MPDLATMTEEESFRLGIFPYRAGGRLVAGDPMKIVSRACRAVPEFDDLVEAFFAGADGPEGESPEEARGRGLALVEAAVALEPAVLAGFRLKPLADDGSGVSTTEAMELLASFLAWQERALARREPGPAGATPGDPGESPEAVEATSAEAPDPA